MRVYVLTKWDSPYGEDLEILAVFSDESQAEKARQSGMAKREMCIVYSIEEFELDAPFSP
jgi:hypothetical protein